LLASIGFGLGRYELMATVNNYLTISKQNHLFKNGKVTDDWYYSFTERYKEKLGFKRINSIDSKRAVACNPITFDNYFEEVTKVYDSHRFHSKPKHVFNCDESGFQCLQRNGKVLCGKGTNPRMITSTNDKKCYTVLTCCNAYGDYLPIRIMHQVKTLKKPTKRAFLINLSYDINCLILFYID
jgi:hypothetical protein